MVRAGWKWARGRGTKQLPILICAVIAVGTAVAGRTHAVFFRFCPRCALRLDRTCA